MKYKGGNEYNGDWKKDKKEGKGAFIYKSGSKYEGSFKNNVKDGNGVFYYKNGDKYQGEFKNGAKAGKGVKFLQMVINMMVNGKKMNLMVKVFFIIKWR